MLMENRNFIQIIISFILLMIAIAIFRLLNLDINFIIMFVFAIFTLFISVFFFIESNKILSIIREKISGIEKSIDKKWHDEEKVKDLSISDSLKYIGLVRKK